MVVGHVIGSDSASGLRAPDGSGWRYAYYTLAPFRMPLFTAISGFVYALRPATAAGWRSFAAGKARRLLVPLCVVGSVFVTLQMLTPGTNARLRPADLPHLVIYPYAHFWYLYALAWIFLLVGACDALGQLRTVARWELLLGAALLVAGSGRLATAFLGLGQAQVLLPYFLLGLGLSRFGFATGSRLAAALLGAGGVGLVLYQGDWFGWWRLDPLGGLAWRVTWRPLAVLGGYSYAIYLMHVFGAAGARIALHDLGVSRLPVLVVPSLVAGLAFPILVQELAMRRRWPARKACRR
jgi:peptidoglycan/LPS O-acetylase OafA/YrhL